MDDAAISDNEADLHEQVYASAEKEVLVNRNGGDQPHAHRNHQPGQKAARVQSYLWYGVGRLDGGTELVFVYDPITQQDGGEEYNDTGGPINGQRPFASTDSYSFSREYDDEGQ